MLFQTLELCQSLTNLTCRNTTYYTTDAVYNNPLPLIIPVCFIAFLALLTTFINLIWQYDNSWFFLPNNTKDELSSQEIRT